MVVLKLWEMVCLVWSHLLIVYHVVNAKHSYDYQIRSIDLG